MKKILFIGTGIILLAALIWCMTTDILSKPENNKDTEDTVLVTDIEIEGANQTAYYNAEYLFTGRVYALYNDDSRNDVTASATITGVNTSVLSTQTATVTYLTFSKTFQVEIIQILVEDIEVDSTNSKIAYKIGEAYTKEGLIVTKVLSDSTKETINNYTVKIYDAENIEVSSITPFTQEGIYKVSISYENVSESYKIIVYADSFELKDIVNPSNIYTNYPLVNGVYAFNSNETTIIDTYLTDILVKGTKSSLRTVDLNGANINVEYGNTSYNACFLLENQSSSMIISVTKKSMINMLVSCKSSESISIKNENGEVIESVGVISETPSLVYFSVEPGNYEISPVEDEIYLYSITASYDITVIEPQITSIELNTSNVKKIFEYGEDFTYTNLIVTTNTEVILSTNEYRCCLSLNGVNKTELGEAGVYQVNVIYLEDESISASYDITVKEEEKNITVKFGYSGPGVSTELCERIINLNAPINPADYIQTPDGYVFTGFSEDNWNQLRNGDVVKIYVQYEKPDQYTVVYLNSSYRCYQIAYVEKNSNVTPITDYPEVPGKVFTGWDTSKLTPVISSIYVLPNYINDGGDFGASLSFNSESSVTIDLNLDPNISYEYSLKVKSTSFERNITSLSTTLSGLAESNNYTISGYVTYSKNNEKYIKYFEEGTFSTAVFSQLEEITEDVCTIEGFSNGIIVETTGFVDNAPTGYDLDSICLYHNDVLVEEIFYTSQETITFFDLEVGEEYRVDAFFKVSVDQTRSVLRSEEVTVTPGFRIHFVGFRILCSFGDQTLCRINLMYNGELLYRMYWPENTQILEDVFKFMLPKKYEHLTVAGSLDFEDKINTNVDWDLILLDLNATGLDKYTVIFYDSFNSAKIVDLQEISAGKDAVPPTYSDYTSEDGLDLYKFKGFNKEYTNVASHLLLYPTYTTVSLVPVEAEYELGSYVSPFSLKPYLIEIKSENAYVKFKYYIIGGEYDVKTSMGEYEAIFTVSPDTEYTIILEYNYKDQFDKLIEKTDSLNVTTPHESQTLKDGILSDELYNATTAVFSVTTDVAMLEMHDTSGLTAKNYRYIKFGPYSTSQSIGTLKQNTTYDVYYYFKGDDSTRIIYSYYYGQVTTPDASKPVIEKILVNFEYNTCLIFMTVDDNLPVNLEFIAFTPEFPFETDKERFYDISSKNLTDGIYAYIWKNKLAVDPETGEVHQYYTTLTQIFISYCYDGVIFYDNYKSNWEKETYNGKEYCTFVLENR